MEKPILCPFCAETLVDASVDRCTQCGLFIPQSILQELALQQVRRQSLNPLPPTASPPSRSSGNLPVRQATPDWDQEVPVASTVDASSVQASSMMSESPYGGDPSLSAANLAALNSTDHHQKTTQIWAQQSGFGLAIWSLALVNLGDFQGVPFAWLPGISGLVFGFFGWSRSGLGWTLATILLVSASLVISISL